MREIKKPEKIKIDKDFVLLIKELNRVGLETTQCCSGHKNGNAYLTIALSKDCDFIFRSIDNIPRLLIRWKRK